jgi:hypothetical protein
MFLEVRKMFVMARCVGKSVKEVVNVGRSIIQFMFCDNRAKLAKACAFQDYVVN